MAVYGKLLKRRRKLEQGYALIFALMATALLTGLGLSLVFSTSGDVAISGNFRRNEHAFFAADAGVGLTRTILRNELLTTVQSQAAAIAGNIVLPSSGQSFDNSQITNLLTASSLTSATGTVISNTVTKVNARTTGITSGSFSISNTDLSLSTVGSPVITRRQNAITGINLPVNSLPPASVAMRYAYSFIVTGKNQATSNVLFQASARAKEQGFIDVVVNLDALPNPAAQPLLTQTFASFAAFFDRFGSGSELDRSAFAAGKFTGRVHTNEKLVFSSSNPLIMEGRVTQSGGDQYIYNRGYKNLTDTSHAGITFNQPPTRVPLIPLPGNTFSQALAVANSTGYVADSTQLSGFREPTGSELQTSLASNLRKADSNGTAVTMSGNVPTTNGVYIASSDGSNITGGGIYVQGNADEVSLSVSGTTQIYTIRQGSSSTRIEITTTVTTDSSTGQVTLTGTTKVTPPSGSAKTYTGVPRQLDSASNQSLGTAIYVNGSIASLHGPAKSDSVTGAAVGKNTALTITASGDITITGDLKYQDQVIDNSGNYVTGGQNAKNVLGVFTNNGAVKLTPNSTYTSGSNRDLTIDAAIVTFNKAALDADASAYTGGIYYSCSDSSSCGLNSDSKLYLRGSRVQSQILGIGYPNRYVLFDPRFTDGAYGPPFFPTTQVNNTGAATAALLLIQFQTPQVTSSPNWQRLN